MAAPRQQPPGLPLSPPLPQRLTDWMRSTVVARSSATRGSARVGLPRDSRTGVLPSASCTAISTSSTIGLATVSLRLRAGTACARGCVVGLPVKWKEGQRRAQLSRPNARKSTAAPTRQQASPCKRAR